MKKVLSGSIVVAMLFIISLPFQNCGQFGIDNQMKFRVISTVNVFENSISMEDDQYLETFDDGSGARNIAETFDNGSGALGMNETTDGGNGNNGMNETTDGRNGTRDPASEQTDGGAGTAPGTPGENQADGGAGGNNPDDMPVELPNPNSPDIYGLIEVLNGPDMYTEIIREITDDTPQLNFPPGLRQLVGPPGVIPNLSTGDGDTPEGGNNGENPNSPNNNGQGVNVTFGNGPNPNNFIFNEIKAPENEEAKVQFYKMPVVRFCTDKHITGSNKVNNTKIARTPFIFATSLEVIIHDMNNKLLCHIKDSMAIRNSVLANGEINLEGCPNKIIAPFKIALFADGNRKNNLFQVAVHKYDLPLSQSKVITADHATSKAKILFHERIIKNKQLIDLTGLVHAKYYAACDKQNSPLFIDLRDHQEQYKGFTLSPPKEGILFDIEGLRALPKPFTKKQISWFEDDRMAFIVLPTKHGEVKGIDQLFGDNTLGPDGQFSKHGFEALAKFDGLAYTENNDPKDLIHFYKRMRRKPDGVIDSQDDVYHKLRLWKDRNGDGVGQNLELYSLEEMGVEVIDLNFDPNFKEQDEFGNVVKYKSVVKMANGDYRLVFDIWFATFGGQ